jgi:hypothetical protein
LYEALPLLGVGRGWGWVGDLHKAEEGLLLLHVVAYVPQHPQPRLDELRYSAAPRRRHGLQPPLV